MPTREGGADVLTDRQFERDASGRIVAEVRDLGSGPERYTYERPSPDVVEVTDASGHPVRRFRGSCDLILARLCHRDWRRAMLPTSTEPVARAVRELLQPQQSWPRHQRCAEDVFRKPSGQRAIRAD